MLCAPSLLRHREDLAAKAQGGQKHRYRSEGTGRPSLLRHRHTLLRHREDLSKAWGHTNDAFEGGK
eukprot:9497699-Pyramimonas_sp.AAC.2